MKCRFLFGVFFFHVLIVSQKKKKSKTEKCYISYFLSGMRFKAFIVKKSSTVPYLCMNYKASHCNCSVIKLQGKKNTFSMDELLCMVVEIHTVPAKMMIKQHLQGNVYSLSDGFLALKYLSSNLFRNRQLYLTFLCVEFLQLLFLSPLALSQTCSFIRDNYVWFSPFNEK